MLAVRLAEMYRTPIHIKTAPDKVSPRVIAVGDPDRATYIAEKFLENPELVNRHRGFLLYTGKYKGERVTIACHGVGASSAAIVFEELVMLGAKVIVRLGTTGALVPELRRGDVVVAAGAGYFLTSPVLELTENVVVPAVPDLDLTVRLYDALRKNLADRRVELARVISNDMFYVENPELAQRLARLGFRAIEMECATLFIVSALRGIRSAGVLLVSNSLVREEERDIPTSDVINKMYDAVVPVVLDVVISFNV